MDTSEKLFLIADDYDDAAELLAELVQADSGYATVAVKDGQAAVDEALGRTFYAALLDIDMPRLSGIDAAATIRTKLGTARPLLLAFTGGPHVAAASNSGLFDHVLTKPIDLRELIALLDAGLPLAAGNA